MLTRVGVPVTSEAEPSAPESRGRNLALLFAPAVELRVPAAAAPHEPLCARDERHLLGRAGRYRAQGDGLSSGSRGAGCAERSHRRPPPSARHAGRCARGRAWPIARRSYRHDPRPADRLVLHADDAALLARTSTRTSPCSTRWTNFSKFKFAPVKLLELEQELIDRADVVFTGGSSLYEAKKDRHHNVHCFPSSVDRAHFCKARARQFDPADQEDLPRPRLGFYGVIDERFDIELLDKVAEMRPDWSFVMVGPVVKISEDELPKRPNIHYLGGKTYDQLPAYLSGWDVALMPFAMNELTQFISPTKTPEYLAGGKPVVSTPIKDVVRHYGQLEGVKIASTPEEFVAACEEALELSRNPESGWLAEADLMLSATSWDTTQARMAGLIARSARHAHRRDNPALLVAAE